MIEEDEDFSRVW